MTLVVGVDSSTQSTKVEIRDAGDGRLLGAGRAPHPAVHPPVAEQDPNAWWAALEAALAAALEAVPGAGRGDLAAISVAAQQHGCVTLDRHREVIRPAKLWCDTSTAPDARWLVDQHPGGAAGWAQACGTVPVASLTVTKLSWLHRNEPDSWDALASVCLPHDWITYRLCGELVTDRGDASGTGYWSPADERYRTDLLALVDAGRDWSDALPRVLGPVEAAGSWHRAVVGPGTGDNMAAALGLGLDPGDVVVSIGTSGTLAVVSESPTADPSGAVAGFADATGRFLPLVCTLNAAGVTDAWARLLGVDAGRLDELALGAPAGAGGLTLVPYLAGERTPDRPDATGALVGLRTDAEPAQVARAAFEGVVCGLLDGLEALAAHAPVDDRRLRLVGGGARSAAYRQILADLADREVLTTDLPEAVATGAAVQAAATLAGADPIAVRAGWHAAATTVTEPGPGAAAADEVRAAFRAARDRHAPPPATAGA